MHLFARAVCFLMILLPLPALAVEPVEWLPPVVGTRITYDMTVNGTAVPATMEVIAVEGDLVRSAIEVGGQWSEELSVRNVINVEGNNTRFDFDPALAVALWPLEAGNSTTVEGIVTTGRGSKAPFTSRLTIEAIETLETPAGSFQAAKIDNRLELRAPDETILFNTTQWIDVASSLPVRTEVEVTSAGDTLYSITMVASDGPTAP